MAQMYDPYFPYAGGSSHAASSGLGAAGSGAAASTGAEAAGGSAMGGAAIMAGGSALTGMMQAMYQQEMEKQKRIAEAMALQSKNAGEFGQNQQQMLAQLMGGYKTALGV